MGRIRARIRKARKRRVMARRTAPLLDQWRLDGPSPRRPRRALLAYITEPIRCAVVPGPYHQNHEAARLIVASLNTAGYIVDVSDHRDPSPPGKGRRYDLALGFGQFFEELCCSATATVPISYATGAHWSHHNPAEARRVAAVNRARGTTLRPIRQIPEWDQFRTSAATISVGNDWTASTYEACGRPVLSVRGPYEVPTLNVDRRDWSALRHRFLFLSGAGLINKGFDLVVEAFARRPHLGLDIVCAPSKRERDVLETFADELASPNITYHGEMRADSREFRSLVAGVGFSILPSCSEGAAGSAIIPGLLGAVPLVTESCGVDIVDPFQLIPDTEVAPVLAVIDRAADLTPSELADLSGACRTSMSGAFDRRTYVARFTEALTRLGLGA